MASVYSLIAAVYSPLEKAAFALSSGDDAKQPWSASIQYGPGRDVVAHWHTQIASSLMYSDTTHTD